MVVVPSMHELNVRPVVCCLVIRLETAAIKPYSSIQFLKSSEIVAFVLKPLLLTVSSLAVVISTSALSLLIV